MLVTMVQDSGLKRKNKDVFEFIIIFYGLEFMGNEAFWERKSEKRYC